MATSEFSIRQSRTSLAPKCSGNSKIDAFSQSGIYSALVKRYIITKARDAQSNFTEIPDEGSE
ncbi:hypothetical protein DXH47_05670 [Levilactobacillus suantsaii]|uniref:Uncharacterized protein n=1 Tax=Levilactobacillus suantsaii TaxID=2292255 RepID=A0A4Q0VI32_9LACO|nr:hypothetical protein DXH47_05670 [Levilactobacillus suantsaii]